MAHTFGVKLPNDLAHLYMEACDAVSAEFRANKRHQCVYVHTVDDADEGCRTLRSADIAGRRALRAFIERSVVE